MKKLQLLALTMLLSTPFAITYTAETAETTEDSQHKVASKNDGKQAERQARRESRQAERQAIRESIRADLADQLKTMQTKKESFMIPDADLELIRKLEWY